MSIYKLLYGADEYFIDITFTVFQKCSGINENGEFVAILPTTDINRSYLFSDPVQGKEKIIQVYKDSILITTLDQHTSITIPIFAKIPKTFPLSETLLHNIHVSSHFRFGFLCHERTEQLMICRFLPSNAKVFEIGTNAGRTALVISSILDDESNFVTIETNEEVSNCAIINRDANKKNKYHIVYGALSTIPMYQKNMDCVSEKIEGYTEVPTLTWEQLKEKYPIDFDTLVIDCEGSFYFIYKEFPSILDNINLIIIENDYRKLEHKLEMDNVFESKGLHCVYRECVFGLNRACEDCFYEVWQKFVSV